MIAVVSVQDAFLGVSLSLPSVLHASSAIGIGAELLHSIFGMTVMISAAWLLSQEFFTKFLGILSRSQTKELFLLGTVQKKNHKNDSPDLTS